MSLKTSVVIPTLNESSVISETLRTLRNIPGISEIIVVDGGSTDDTAEIASTDAKVILTEKGRARQMNEGAKAASGDIILFLHADSIIPPTCISYIEEAVTRQQAVGGCFQLKFDDKSPVYSLIALGSNLRAKFSKIFFGDQGIFVRRDTFFAIGGFPELPIMEEWEFCQLLKSKGKVVQLKCPIVTSTRRFEKYGVWKTLLLMHKLKILYIFGTSPDKLKQIYPDNS